MVECSVESVVEEVKCKVCTKCGMTKKLGLYESGRNQCKDCIRELKRKPHLRERRLLLLFGFNRCLGCNTIKSDDSFKSPNKCKECFNKTRQNKLKSVKEDIGKNPDNYEDIKCNKCNVLKPVYDFRVTHKTCKDCTNIKKKEYIPKEKVGTTQCSVCKKLKLPHEFNAHGKRCKKCGNINGKKYREENKEKNIIRHEKYRKENIEKIRISAKKYKAENKDKTKAYKHKRRARLKDLPHTLTLDEWNETLEHFDNRCARCGSAEKIHQDHWIPINSDDSSNTAYNCIPLCETCNCSKGHKLPHIKYKDELEFYNMIEEYLKTRISDKGANDARSN